jgi:HEAT repeat protein
LFVLAQSHSQQSRDILAQAARGASNPDLQLKAVEYLGIFGGKESLQTLTDVYKSSSDLAVKRAILRSLMISGSRDQLLAAAKSESNPDLKIEAIRQLGNMGGAADLAQLYTNESSPQVKHVIIQAMFVSGNADKLFDLAKGEKDAGLRLEAIRQLGLMGRQKTAPFLIQMYAQDSDQAVKKAVIESLFIQANAPALVDLAKKESDPQMKKRIVERLSMMQSKEATDYLMELLK